MDSTWWDAAVGGLVGTGAYGGTLGNELLGYESPTAVADLVESSVSNGVSDVVDAVTKPVTSLLPSSAQVYSTAAVVIIVLILLILLLGKVETL